MAGFRGKGIRFKMTLVATAGALLASAIVVVATAWALQSVLERSLADELSGHLDKAQEAVATGDYEAAVLFTGSDIMQVIAEDGTVLSSSANARNLAAIIDGLDDDVSIVESSGLKLRETERDDDDDDGDDSDGGQVDGQESAPAETASSDDQAASNDRSDDDDDDDDDDAWDDDDDAWDDDGAWNGRSYDDDAWDDRDDDDEGDEGRDDDADEGDDDDDGDDDAEDDSDEEERVVRSAAHDGDDEAEGATRDSDDSGDDEGDDDDGDDDDEADDDDDDGGGGGGKKKMRASSLFVERAYAAEPGEGSAASSGPADQGPFVDASNVFGNDGPYLVMQRKVESPDGMVTLPAAMTSLAPVLTAVQAAAQVLVVVMTVLLAAVAFFTWRLTGRTLRPVEQMRANVAAINEGDLSMRVDVPQGDRDLAPLATTFNELLARIEASVERQKHFISDASHELKSPVAATGVMLEAMREYPEAIDMGQAIGDLSAENERMGRIVGNMLVLARHDEGRTVVDPVPVDLFDLVREEALRLAHATSLDVDTADVHPVVCTTDRELLSHVLRNLLDNAGHYARERVKVSCEEREGAVRITVSDDGPGIPPADRERVFERFVRLEEGTNRRKESTGLGLSVVKGSVEQLGGTVRFADPELGGATAIVELPLA